VEYKERTILAYSSSLSFTFTHHNTLTFTSCTDDQATGVQEAAQVVEGGAEAEVAEAAVD